MRTSLTVCAGAILLSQMGAAAAAPKDYLFRNERICTPAEDFCLRGTLTYQPNPRLLQVRARVQIASGPGLLRITVIGANRLGYKYLAPMEIEVRGQRSEIINHKMIPDHPDVEAWSLDRIEFIAESSG